MSAADPGAHVELDAVQPVVIATATFETNRAGREPSPWLTTRQVEQLLSSLSPVVLLAAWEIAAFAGRVDTRFFPAPSSILRATGAMLQTGELWTHVSVTLQRIAIGFTLGALPGVVVGVAMGLFGPVRAIIQPLIDATFPLPKIAILPLFIMVFGIGEESKYAIIAVAVVYLVLINTLAGVRTIDSMYLDVGKNFHASRLMMFTDIALPGAMPMILTGLKLGMGVALLVIVSAEFVGANSGIGFLIWTSWQVFQVEKMYIGLLVTALLGFATAILLNVVEKHVVPWKA